MTSPLARLQHDLSPYRARLREHALYRELTDLNALKWFMSIHVYAVWDFMNLLTSLQGTFTSVSAPWKPPKDAQLARFINAIKLEEESDVIEGEATSHFQYYIKSMKALEVDTTEIELLLEALTHQSYESILEESYIPEVVRPFLRTTYECIQSGTLGTVASFTFGRETVIPDMFIHILEACQHEDPAIDAFKRYLARHIELDGNEHGDLAIGLVSHICGDNMDHWLQVERMAKRSILARVELYDRILELSP
jgi:hypothetical protein